MSFHVPERFRIRSGRVASDETYGNNGAFALHLGRHQSLHVIASDGAGWEHVSVSRTDRCPTWDEMCQIKDIFWDDEDCVIQFHPPRSEYVNCHPYCLHLWSPVGENILVPASILVGLSPEKA